MKKTLSVILLLAMMIVGISGCQEKKNEKSEETSEETEIETKTKDLGDDNKTFGDSLDDLKAYEGYFEDDIVDITISCVSGTEGCYNVEGNVVTFTNVKEDSVYYISGQLKGNIIIDVGDDYKFDLELRGLSLVCDNTNPIMIVSGDKVSITAKSEYDNYIYDMRDSIDETDETLYSAAIYSTVDLEICGKGSLTVISENNNGIHGKDDLEVKNLNLLVACLDNALKGNDSVTIANASTTLIASKGDGIKTTNSDVSKKGNQRGTISFVGGTHNIYAACDGIDAAYNVVIDEETTVLNIYTDKYSNYSTEVTTVDENQYYIRFTSKNYQYSIKYYNSDDDYKWVNAQYHSTVSGGRYSYYYYSFPKLSNYSKMQLYIYSSDMTQGQEEDYLAQSDYLTLSSVYDTFALSSQGNSLSYKWTNYTTTISESGFGGRGGMGGMSDGNSDKGDYSTKGIKADNEIIINAGEINIKSYDDAIHANNDTTLENGETPSGNVTINGGVISIYTNDDGLHADGTLSITNGTISVSNSYEGLEGTNVSISGGNVSIIASDDGINGTTTTNTAIEISGGKVYINCSGDGIDSNSRTSYKGIVFSGGKTVVISNSSGNSAIDTEQGYEYSGGEVIAIMPSRGMTSEATHCSNFSKVGTSSTLSLSANNYLVIKDGNNEIASVKMPISISAMVIYLGDKSASITSSSTSSANFDSNNVSWND